MKIDLGDGVALELAEIPSGSFLMGSPEDEKCRFADEGPQHLVHLESFWMGRHPVTQAQWKQVVLSVPTISLELNPEPSCFDGDNLPVECVSWDEAKEFCRRLSRYSAPRAFRLPSEAQWEYACRAGTTTAFYFGEKLPADLVNHHEATEVGETTPVDKFPPNPWGLHDMYGNVWEWCEDDWHIDYEGAPTDGSAWLSPSPSRLRVARGGAWASSSVQCRSANRCYFSHSFRDDDLGFRVVTWHPAIGG